MSEMHTPVAAAPAPVPAAAKWERFTFGQRMLRYALTIFCVWAIVQSLASIEVIPEFLYDAPEQMADMLGRMWPVDWAYYQPDVHIGLMETLHMATLGRCCVNQI